MLTAAVRARLLSSIGVLLDARLQAAQSATTRNRNRPCPHCASGRQAATKTQEYPKLAPGPKGPQVKTTAERKGRQRRKQELKGPASRNPKRPSSTGAPSSTQREPARQAGLGGGGWWVQTCRAHVALCTVTVLVYGSFIITNLNLNGAVPGRLMLVVPVAVSADLE